MPIYEFECRACGAALEALRRMGQGPEGLECPRCGGTDLVQKLSSFATSAGSAPSCSTSPTCGAGGGGGGG
ncbi:MAG TPA: zinc ribbon domain-containing protein [Acidobacteria bacterium]|nr:zinc ribbon domain-containing protein [Acidobacteriota bacterium]